MGPTWLSAPLPAHSLPNIGFEGEISMMIVRAALALIVAPLLPVLNLKVFLEGTRRE